MSDIDRPAHDEVAGDTPGKGLTRSDLVKKAGLAGAALTVAGAAAGTASAGRKTARQPAAAAFAEPLDSRARACIWSARSTVPNRRHA